MLSPWISLGTTPPAPLQLLDYLDCESSGQITFILNLVILQAHNPFSHLGTHHVVAVQM